MFSVFLSHSSEEAEALAKRLKLRFYRASVKEDLNVNEGELLLQQTNDYLLTVRFLSKLCSHTTHWLSL